MKLSLQKYWIEGMFLLVGAVAGAVGTYLYTVKVEERKLYLQERLAGYKELFDGTVALWQSRDIEARAANEKAKGNESKAEKLESEAQKQRELSDTHYRKARFSIGVFGDADVVRALAKYWSGQKNPCTSPQIMLDDVAIYQSMRGALAARGQAKDKDLIRVLFACDMEE